MEEKGYEKKVAAFKARILPANSVLIVIHDFPDPDCLASAAGLVHLLTYWGVPTCKITYGGFVGRAENRTMVQLLEMSAVPIAFVDLSGFDRIIVADSLPGGGNVSLPPETKVDAVFDHHMDAPDADAPYFFDVRKDIGATSTLITQYLTHAGCPIPRREATALYYGIKTDTNGMGRDAFPEDLECYKRLFDLLDHQLLFKIEHPQREIEFFKGLDQALHTASIFGDTAYIYTGEVNTPDHVGEMADFFSSLKTLEWTVCAGIFREKLYFSLRCKTLETAGSTAREIARQCGGSGGGHGKIGAGQIPLNSKSMANNPSHAFKNTAKKVLDRTSLPEISLLKSADE
ncbi:MAG: DHH family phosphoesterase [Desulfatibacillaceae bacterium]|nr:DHH family phosphoesterase [Desulfatibacillaceae bacterium]